MTPITALVLVAFPVAVLLIVGVAVSILVERPTAFVLERLHHRRLRARALGGCVVVASGAPKLKSLAARGGTSIVGGVAVRCSDADPFTVVG